MKLESPNTDPYSTYHHRIDSLEKKGYIKKFDIVDESTMKDEEGNTYTPHDLVINEIHRLVSKDNESEKTTIYALSANNGAMGIVIDTYGENSDETIDDFLQKVDTHDNLHEQ